MLWLMEGTATEFISSVIRTSIGISALVCRIVITCVADECLFDLNGYID